MKVAVAIKKLNSHAKKFDGHVEDDSTSDVNLQICAPDGKEWIASDGAHIVCCTAYGPQSWLDEAVEDAIQRINEGTRDAEPEEACEKDPCVCA